MHYLVRLHQNKFVSEVFQRFEVETIELVCNPDYTDCSKLPRAMRGRMSEKITSAIVIKETIWPPSQKTFISELPLKTVESWKQVAAKN